MIHWFCKKGLDLEINKNNLRLKGFFRLKDLL